MRLRMDWLLFGTILALVSFGLVMVYSASISLEIRRAPSAAAGKAQPKADQAVQASDAAGAPSKPPAPNAPSLLFGWSWRRLIALALGVVAARFFWRNYRSGVFTPPWAMLGGTLVVVLQLLAYWMDVEKSPHLAIFARQAGAALGGFFLMMYLSQRDYRQFRNAQWAFSALGCVIFLLILVYYTDPQHRWLRFGISVQPSELAKPALVLFLAWFVTLRRTAINHPATIWPAALALVVLAGAVMIPDVGTAVVLIVTAAVVFYMAGLNWRYTTAALGIGLLFLAVAIVHEPYRLKRVIQFADPEYKYLIYVDPNRRLLTRADKATRVPDTQDQSVQAEIAVGTGRVFGRGAGESRQIMFLPEAHNDYIFAIVAEQLGLVGSTFLLGGFMILLWRGYRLFFSASDDFGRYLAVGVSTMLVFQALLNMSVVLGLFPPKGIPLPLISFGGTSMLSSMLLLGLLLSVSQRSSA